MLLRALVIASVTAVLSAEAASAEGVSPSAISGVSFSESGSHPLNLDIVARATNSTPSVRAGLDLHTPADSNRSYEAVLTQSGIGGSDVDVSLSQRTNLSVGADGALSPHGRGAEVRVGHGLARLVQPYRNATWDKPAWYVFAASDDEALAWTPGAGRGLRYQADRVNIGDTQVGVAMEAMGAQAAIAYVQRNVQGKYGSAEENYTGLTFTWRR